MLWTIRFARVKTLIGGKCGLTLQAQFNHAPQQIRETFEDYIPPQKNLGALFIKAYNKEGGSKMMNK